MYLLYIGYFYTILLYLLYIDYYCTILLYIGYYCTILLYHPIVPSYCTYVHSVVVTEKNSRPFLPWSLLGPTRGLILAWSS